MSALARNYKMRISSIRKPGKYPMVPIYELEYSGIFVRGNISLHDYISDIRDSVVKLYEKGKCGIDNMTGSFVIEAKKGRMPFSKAKCIITPKEGGIDIVVPNSSPFNPDKKSLQFMDSLIRNTPLKEIMKDCLEQVGGVTPLESQDILIGMTPLANDFKVI
jgi:hypothetical protein